MNQNETSPTLEKVFHSSDDYFDDIIEKIQMASQSIQVEMYIFYSDHLGLKVQAALIEAALRGVEVRIVVDGVGSPHWLGEVRESLAQYDVHSRIYHPIPFPFSRLPFEDVWPPSKLLYLLWLVNRRNHKKCIIIDGSTAYVGSMNIHDETLIWREVGCRIMGPEVSTLQQSFELSWKLSYPSEYFFSRRKIKRRVKSSVGVFLNHTRRLRRKSNRYTRALLREAENRIWMVSPYFVPEIRLASAINKALSRGVDVRLVHSQDNDLFFMTWINRYYLYQFLKRGALVYEYNGFNHAKIRIIDQQAFLGSSNLNHRSFYHDLEVDISLKNQESISALEKAFLNDVEKSVQLSVERLKWYHYLQFAVARILVLFRDKL